MAYRLALAEGFLKEAEQDMGLSRWRSCVDNAQLSVENSGKAALCAFGAPPKTHDPAREISRVLRSQDLDVATAEGLRALVPELLALGAAEHFLTDYGDESTHTLPWDLFTEVSAREALEAAQRSLEATRSVLSLISP